MVWCCCRSDCPYLSYIRSKIFTHLITVLERCGQVIAKICPDQEKQILLIDEVNFFWKKSTQMTAMTIDRMMGYRLISNLAIVRWVFSPANVELFHTSDRLWEVPSYPCKFILYLDAIVIKSLLAICNLGNSLLMKNKGKAACIGTSPDLMMWEPSALGTPVMSCLYFSRTVYHLLEPL